VSVAHIADGVDQVAKCHIKLELKNDSFTELRGEIAGPPDTPYEGATYILDIKIPETYPFNPPKVCHCLTMLVTLFELLQMCVGPSEQAIYSHLVHHVNDVAECVIVVLVHTA